MGLGGGPPVAKQSEGQSLLQPHQADLMAYIHSIPGATQLLQYPGVSQLFNAFGTYSQGIPGTGTSGGTSGTGLG